MAEENHVAPSLSGMAMSLLVIVFSFLPEREYRRMYENLSTELRFLRRHFPTPDVFPGYVWVDHDDSKNCWTMINWWHKLGRVVRCSTILAYHLCHLWRVNLERRISMCGCWECASDVRVCALAGLIPFEYFRRSVQVQILQKARWHDPPPNDYAQWIRLRNNQYAVRRRPGVEELDEGEHTLTEDQFSVRRIPWRGRLVASYARRLCPAVVGACHRLTGFLSPVAYDRWGVKRVPGDDASDDGSDCDDCDDGDDGDAMSV
jgi:hypothetical protein